MSEHKNDLYKRARERVLSCKPSPLREAMLKNIDARAFVDADHLEANVANLEKEQTK